MRPGFLQKRDYRANEIVRGEKLVPACLSDPAKLHAMKPRIVKSLLEGLQNRLDNLFALFARGILDAHCLKEILRLPSPLTKNPAQ